MIAQVHLPRRSARRPQRGFSLLELMIVVVLAALLLSIAIPAYTGYIDRGRVAASISDMGRIELEIERFRLNNDDRLPNSLAELGLGAATDPYGNAYVYLNIVALGGALGPVRKDRNLNPLNSDYDLYSLGKDGDSRPPLTVPVSRDDIIRANNGAYFGLAGDY